ncbi:HAD family hydrolase [Sulfurimonas marina]|uniref:phosphoglycolate phosphatase n=1 Tax=Sulfurimonas marina TaxID=2590551 RepID=A0A7M1B0L1_9BACT|nr:HAD family hydrolase [Sulfurimonas marina]QOP42258.1 HAD family hydrolase [Sulfurimonas marina]
MKKYILFDNDGVLIETEMWYFEASKRALKEFFDLELTFERYMEIMAKGQRAWVIAEEIGISEDEIVKAREKRDEYYQEHIKTKEIAIEGVLDTLKELSKNYRMGIVTTSRRVDFELAHSGRGITEFMDFVLCVEDYPRAKPHPDPYLKGMELFGATKEECIIVEDSKRGLSSAVNASIECVIVHNEFTRTHDFSDASYKINKFSELQELLNSIA